ncbi:endonuclease domain-containing protein [Stutzerimonas nitrititolerans]|uniref:endonuclease domain-containing protein n=1 Tax=Stutzerimonas nitrititolerans TaxID=2482751 RepID=UPI000F78AFB6|nr:endonuclease domain-containing protein [Stutzerimonas nitrititolerans]RRV25550.1 endonuclease domain-containing protein [Pseudomonas sp. s199]
MPSHKPSPAQREFAKRLRNNLTDCERLLWRRLRNRQLSGYKFRRQHPFPPYVLDFYCAELRLVVELDGGQHYGDVGLEKDRLRTDYLERQDLRMLRFSNLDVLQNLEGVLAEIVCWIEAAPLTPTLSPQRRGG